MWHDMFTFQLPVAEKLLRTVLVYALIVVIFRVAGKRNMAGLNTFDFVVIFLLSNVVQNAVIGNDNSLAGGVVGAVTLVVVNELLNHLSVRYAWVSRLLQGTSTIVIRDGRPVTENLRRLAMSTKELEHAVRIQNGDEIREVQVGELAETGHLVLTLRPEEQSADKADIAALNRRLDAIETLLASLTVPGGRPRGV
ncbi:DUF421 domain-containing protein [Sphaerisporangium album]|uniref:DUF421 domain-containing protein n=1 Tax=Sphaerisporangium album TaxID=509200 RepID=A0A367FKH8_9ACTN|nr:YetF domain-containing protein [Sphaerisporangium album]RCG30741.1 DUF421 domain-containing protein [Sphaerisporangium album]